MCGSKTTGQTTTTNTPPPQVLAAYQNVVNQAQGVAATPYQAYSGELTAPVNQQQSAGIAGINSATGIQNPYNSTATGLLGASASAIDPTQFSPAQLQQYESPFQSDVVNSTMALINNQNQQQQQQLAGNAISAGAFGGDRAGVAQAALAGQQDLASNATLANLNNQNYQQALGEFNTQQALGLGAAQNTAARQLAAGQQIAGLGSTAQQEALTGAAAQVGAGSLQQQTQQARDTADYNQFLQKVGYPFQTTGWLANIVEGIGSQEGGTSTATTQGGNGLSTALGGLATIGSMFLKDGGRVPHMAGGGGLGATSPYAVPDNTGLGGGSYVPTINLGLGHTMPTASAPKQEQFTPTAQNMSSLGALGKAAGSGLSGLFSGPTQLAGATAPATLGTVGYGGSDLGDFGGIYRRGGVVGRPHYADGGDIADDPTSLILDPNAVSPSLGGFSPGLGAAAMQPTGLVAAPAAAPMPPDVIPPPKAGLVPAPQRDATPPMATGVVAPSDTVASPPAVSADRPTGVVPRSIRNNNPGNIEDGAFAQRMPGYAGTDGRFAQFDTPQAGTAAQDHLLQVYGHNGVDTPLGITSRWAPAGDGSNNPGAYADFIAKRLGVGPTDKINLADPNVRATVQSAMADFEAGHGGASGTAVAARPGLGATGSGALAYTDTPTPGLGAASTAIDASTAQPQASNPLQSPGHKGLLGVNLSDDARMALLSAGLGMLAGKSMNPFNNIGEGGLAGVQAYRQAQQLRRENALANSQMQNTQSEIATRSGTLKQGQQRVDLEGQNMFRQAQLAASQIANTNSEIATRKATVAKDLQTATPAGMLVRDPDNPTAPPKLIPWSAMTGTSPSAPAAPNAGASAAAPPPSQTGAPTPAPASPATGAPGAPAAPRAPADPYATTSGITVPDNPPIDTRQFSPTGQQIAADEAKESLKSARTAYEGSVNTQQQVAQMRHALDNLPSNGFLTPGAGFQARADLAKKVNSVLSGFGISNENLLNDPSAVASGEELKKLTNRMGFDLAKSLGGREPGFIVQQAVGSVPSGDNTPLGAKRLLAGIEAMAKRQQDYYLFLQNWSVKTGGSTAFADDYFNKVNPPQKYVAEAIASTIPPGAVDYLRTHPDTKAAFDKKFGSVSGLILGQ